MKNLWKFHVRHLLMRKNNSKTTFLSSETLFVQKVKTKTFSTFYHSYEKQSVDNENKKAPGTFPSLEEDLDLMKKKIDVLENKIEYLKLNKSVSEEETGLTPSRAMKLQNLSNELLVLCLKANQLQKAEQLINEMVPPCVAVYGENNLQLSNLLYTMAHVQFFMGKNIECLQNLYEVIRIRQGALKSGIQEMKEGVLEATLAFNYVTFFSDFFMTGDIPFTETEKNKLYNVYVGNRNNVDAGTFPKLDWKLPLHKMALSFPEKSRFKLAQTILQGKVDKVQKTLKAVAGTSNVEQIKQLHYLLQILYSKLGALYEMEMRYKKSYETYKLALEECGQCFGAESVEAYEIMAEMASVLGKLGILNDECVVWGKKAIVGLNSIPKDQLKESPHLELKIAKSLAALAQTKLNDEPKDALKLANQASKIYERIDGKSSAGWISTAYIFAEAYDNMADEDVTAMPLATRMYEEIEEAILSCLTPSLLRLPLKSSPEFEEMLGDYIIDIAARTYFPSALATHYINVGCRYVIYYMDTKTAAEYLERALKILDEEQSDDYFSLEREFAATQLASFYVILKQDAKMEKLKAIIMNRLKRVLGTNHPFYKDQEKHFANLKNTIEMSGKTMEERLAKMEEMMKDPKFQKMMNDAMIEFQEMEKLAAKGELNIEHEIRKEKEIKDLTEQRLEELLKDKKKMDRVMGFQTPPLKEVLPIPKKQKAKKNS